MDNNDEPISGAGDESVVVRAGAFAKRRNPIVDHPSESDVSSAEVKSSSPLHTSQENCNDDAESPCDRHRRLEWEAILRSYRNAKLLLSSLLEVTPRGTLTLINLSRRGMGKDEAVLIKEAIISNPQLYVLKLPYNNLGDEGASIIASAISIEIGKQHHHLSVLDLGFNCIGDTGCGFLALHCVAGNKNLNSLCLAGNQFGQEGVFAIATAIMHGTVLRTLHLSANKIGPDGIKAIAGAIAKNESNTLQVVANGEDDRNSTRPMEELYLGSTFMTSAGFSAISVLVLLNSSLRSLSLCDNNLDDRDMMLLSQALTQNGKKIPLELLHLSFNQITCQGVECLMNSFWGSTTLRELKLDNNKVKDRGAQLCAVGLTSIDLQTLDLSFNRVSTVGVKALMKTLTDNTSLQSLAISGIPIDQAASKAVSYALAYNISLTALYLDNCSTAYASQRHIIAGAVSNSRSSLKKLTGFRISQIAMTLGMPWLPELWTNDQVLGFFRYMWKKWLQKLSNDNESNHPQRGPAPPASVAAASKIAFSMLGPNAVNLLRTEDHNKPLKEGAPVEPAESALLARTDSGTLSVPLSIISVEMEISETDVWESRSSLVDHAASISSDATIRFSNDPERRKMNVRWLRHHFRSLSEVGRLPFHNADLWQLHQYFFSPPFHGSDKSVFDTNDPPSNVPYMLPIPNNEQTFKPEHAALLQTFADALNDDSSMHGIKRTTPFDSDHREVGPATKKIKNVKPRIEYYPRIMAKLHSIGTKPTAQTLSLLRQLKYLEGALLTGRNLYVDDCGSDLYPSYLDIEMILLDIL